MHSLCRGCHRQRADGYVIIGSLFFSIYFVRLCVVCCVLCVPVTASEVLKVALDAEELQRVPLLVFANKIDCEGAMSSDEVERDISSYTAMSTHLNTWYLHLVSAY